ncbi:MAG: TrbI/VirB10 family protein [Nitrospirota bacterium]
MPQATPRVLVGLAVALVFAVPATAVAITADELRELTRESEQAAQARAARAKTEEPAVNLPAVQPPSETSESAPPARPHSRKYSSPPGEVPTTSPASAPSAESGRPVHHSQKTYVPPPRLTTSGPVTDAIPRDLKRLFGIRLGAWMPGRLTRTATNTEPGLVEIELTEDVAGDKKTLPAGTLVFAHKQYNDGTKRLELQVEKGITPSGLEFALHGLVFDLHKMSGLIGSVSNDTSRVVERGTKKGLLAAGGAAAQQFTGSTPLGAASSAAASSILSESEQAVDESTRPSVTIQVPAQPLLIRVEDTF